MEWARFEGFTMPIVMPPGQPHNQHADARGAEAPGPDAKKRRAAAATAVAEHAHHRQAVAEARAQASTAEGKGKQHDGRHYGDDDHHVHSAARAAAPSSHGSKLASSSSSSSSTPSLSGKKQLADVGDEHEHEEGDVSGPHVFNPREAAGTLQGYMAEHPDFASSALAWVVVGSVLFFVAILVLIFSEVRVVLVVRDQDFRRDMSKRGYMDETEKLSELELREQDTVAARPYLTAGSMVSHPLFFLLLLFSSTMLFFLSPSLPPLSPFPFSRVCASRFVRLYCAWERPAIFLPSPQRYRAAITCSTALVCQDVGKEAACPRN